MTKAKTVDLASLSAKDASEKGYELELRHPVSREPLGVFITIVGAESETARNYLRKKANAKLRQEFENQRKGRDEEPPTVEQAEAEAVSLLAACTTGWRTGDASTVTHGGKALEFNESNARFLYGERWIRSQVDVAWSDLGNFMPG